MELFTPGHLLVLAIVVAVLFFGGKQLPDMARSLGRSLRIFKTEIKGMSEDDKKRAEAANAGGTPAVPPAVEAPPAVPQVPAVPPADNQASTAPTGSNGTKPTE